MRIASWGGFSGASGPDETVVEGAGEGGVVGAGNDGSAVGEDGENLRERRRVKFDEEGILIDVADGAESRGEFRE